MRREKEGSHGNGMEQAGEGKRRKPAKRSAKPYVVAAFVLISVKLRISVCPDVTNTLL